MAYKSDAARRTAEKIFQERSDVAAVDMISSSISAFLNGMQPEVSGDSMFRAAATVAAALGHIIYTSMPDEVKDRMPHAEFVAMFTGDVATRLIAAPEFESAPCPGCGQVGCGVLGDIDDDSDDPIWMSAPGTSTIQ
jgi:hypothetical protein